VCHPVPQGQTVNTKSFLQYHICCTIREKYPELVKNVTIRHDNATGYSADTVKLFSGLGGGTC
jgi:hypothetical protein